MAARADCCWVCGKITRLAAGCHMYYCAECDVKWANPDDPGTAEVCAKNTKTRRLASDSEAELFKAPPAEADAALPSHP